MLQRKLVVLALASAALLPASYAFAEDQASTPPQATQQQQVRGSQVMTREERIEHRRKLRQTRTKEEREQVRKEEHERLKKRAKEQGKQMPDQPPAQGGGMGPGGGMGRRGN